MNDNRYDRIIERYINGEMTPAEEEDFRDLLELDPDLRTLFETEQRMTAALRKELEALTGIDHARTDSRFPMPLAPDAPSDGDASTETAGRMATNAISRNHGPVLWLCGLGIVIATTITLLLAEETGRGALHGRADSVAASIPRRPGRTATVHALPQPAERTTDTGAGLISPGLDTGSDRRATESVLPKRAAGSARTKLKVGHEER